MGVSSAPALPLLSRLLPTSSAHPLAALRLRLPGSSKTSRKSGGRVRWGTRLSCGGSGWRAGPDHAEVSHLHQQLGPEVRNVVFGVVDVVLERCRYAPDSSQSCPHTAGPSGLQGRRGTRLRGCRGQGEAERLGENGENMHSAGAGSKSGQAQGKAGGGAGKADRGVRGGPGKGGDQGDEAGLGVERWGGQRSRRRLGAGTGVLRTEGGEGKRRWMGTESRVGNKGDYERQRADVGQSVKMKPG